MMINLDPLPNMTDKEREYLAKPLRKDNIPIQFHLNRKSNYKVMTLDQLIKHLTNLTDSYENINVQLSSYETYSQSYSYNSETGTAIKLSGDKIVADPKVIEAERKRRIAYLKRKRARLPRQEQRRLEAITRAKSTIEYLAKKFPDQVREVAATL